VKETASGSVQQKIGSTENRTATFALIGVTGTIVAIGVSIVVVIVNIATNAP
jgi:putative flippase GtrA